MTWLAVVDCARDGRNPGGSAIPFEPEFDTMCRNCGSPVRRRMRDILECES